MKKINWNFIWGYYLLVSTFSEKSQLLFLRWGWKNVGGTHVWEKSQIGEKTRRWVWVWENIYLVAQFGEKNSNFLRNLRFEKISALVAPRPGTFVVLKVVCIWLKTTTYNTGLKMFEGIYNDRNKSMFWW